MLDRGILWKLEVALGQQKSAQAWRKISSTNQGAFSQEHLYNNRRRARK
jgi:hypothetical protein